MKYVLFVCTHNAGRLQIAQAFFERDAPSDIRAESAGEEPAAAIWPNVVEFQANRSSETVKISARWASRSDLFETDRCVSLWGRVRVGAEYSVSPTDQAVLSFGSSVPRTAFGAEGVGAAAASVVCDHG